MSTFITFPDGTNVHIVDVCINGKKMHKFVEIEQTYEREKIAIKRAINMYRRRKHNSIKVRRHRKRIKHCRSKICTCVNSFPTIVGFRENEKKRYFVVETGKKFKRLNNAVKNVMEYVKQHTK